MTYQEKIEHTAALIRVLELFCFEMELGAVTHEDYLLIHVEIERLKALKENLLGDRIDLLHQEFDEHTLMINSKLNFEE